MFLEILSSTFYCNQKNYNEVSFQKDLSRSRLCTNDLFISNNLIVQQFISIYVLYLYFF